MDWKYQIFVSSTYDDLREERKEVITARLNMGHLSPDTIAVLRRG